MSAIPPDERRTPPSSAQLYLWSLGLRQSEIARAVGKTPRAITAMLRGEIRLCPDVANCVAQRFDHRTAAELERLCTESFDNHPKRPANREVSA